MKENSILWCYDTSNNSLRFVRNKIRKKIFPMLERELNPRTIEALSRIPSIVSQESKTLDIFGEQAWKRVLKKREKVKINFRRREFFEQPEALQFRILEKALKMLDPLSGLNFEAWQRVREYLARGQGRHSLPKDIDFHLTSKAVSLYKKFPSASHK